MSPFCNQQLGFLSLIFIAQPGFFRGGFCLALAHDFRIMKENEQKGRAMMAMNEVEFGAPVPVSKNLLWRFTFPSFLFPQTILQPLIF
jgi:hypothetical protein